MEMNAQVINTEQIHIWIINTIYTYIDSDYTMNCLVFSPDQFNFSGEEVAQGQAPGGAGWGSYLHRWSGLAG